MKNIILSMIIFFVYVNQIKAQEWIYAKQFSSTGDVTPVDIVFGTDNNIYVAGLYKQPLTIGSTTLPYSDLIGDVDIFLCSFTSDGSFRWARQIGGDKMDEVGGIAIDNSNNIYIVGSFRSLSLAFPPSTTTLSTYNNFDGFLAKYNNDGDLIFADRIFWGSGAQRLTDVAVDFSNNLLAIIGNLKTELKYYDGVDEQTITVLGLKDNLLARYDLSGNFIDIQTFEGSQVETLFKTVNNCVYGGSVQGYFVTGDLKGKLYLPGNDTLKGDEVNMDAMLIRFDNNLGYMWSRRGGGGDYEHVNSAGRGTAGNIYIAGKCQSGTMTFDSTATLQSAPISGFGGFDYYLAKYNRNGYLQWIRRKGGTGLDNAYGLAVSGSRVVTAGNIDNSGNINTGFDLYDISGNFIIGDVITGSAEDQGQGVAFDLTGDSIFVTGYFKSDTLRAGPLKLANTVAGVQDGFMVKYGYRFKIYLAEKTNVTCNGGVDGYIKVGTQFGVEPVTYTWTPNVSTTFEASDLSAGTFKIMATDGSGKKDSVDVIITQPAAITITTDLVQDASCFDGDDGEIRVTVTGGTAPRTLTWSGPGSLVQNNPIQTGLVAGSYSFDVEDANGCTAHEDFEVGQATKMIFYGSEVDTIKIPPGCNGAVDLAVNGGTPGYTFSWSSGPTTEDISGLCLGGNYNVEVTDASLCVQDTTFNVPSDTSLNITICKKTNITCKGESDGYAKVCVTFGGTGSYNYAWRTSGGDPVGGNDLELSDVEKGTYYVTVTDIGNGKTAETSVKIEEPAIALTAVFAEVRDISCYGKNDGYINLTVSNGWGGYKYHWDPRGDTIQDVSNLTKGEWIVTITDAGNCAVQKNTNINEPPQLTVSILVEDSISCNGESDGALKARPSGGTGPDFTFLWNDEGAQNDSIASDLHAGNYTVKVTDTRGCYKNASKTLSQPGVIDISFTPVNVKCKGGSDGTVTTTVSGGTAGYTYSWGDGPTTKNRTDLAAGTYCLTVTDVHGCTGYKCIDITEPANKISIGKVITDVKCNSGNDGVIDITASGGTPGYTYSWSHGPATEDANGLSAGTYTITVTDANGCTQDSTFTVNEPTAIVINNVITDITCNNGSDGEIDITVSGGTPVYTYSWSNGPATEDVSLLTAGDYTITVTDANSCTLDSTFTVSEPAAIQIAKVITNVSCFNGNDGAIDITASGGTPGYTYSWSHGPTTEDVSLLTTGDYTVTVTDDNSCTQDSTFTVTEPASAIQIDKIITDVNCKGGNDGAINITPTGGTPGYTFSWSHGPTTEDVSGLTAGDYTVTVTDANSCIQDSTYTVTEPPTTIQIDRIITDVSCNGGNNGAVDITASGGTPGYTYSWSHGPATEDVTALSAGNYTVTVTDANACTRDSTFTVNEPSAIVINRVISDITCNNGSDGEIDITVSGGTGGYTYSWSHGPTTEDVTGLSAGNFSITVTDGSGCTQDSTFTVSEPEAIQIAKVITNVSCFDGNDGAIDITPSGGTQPYTYSWSHGPTIEDVSGLTAGDYTVTVTDVNSCTQDSTYTVTEPASTIQIEKVITDALCNGGNDGAIDITTSGGTPGYTYSWSNGPTTEDVSGLTAGDYTVTVTDANSCTQDSTFTVTDPASTIQIEKVITNANCNGGNDGAIDITPSGGTSPYTYSWSHGPTTEDLSGLTAGGYTVTVTDANSCTQDSIFTVTEPDRLIFLSIVIDSTSHADSANGVITLTAGGGTAPYVYFLDSSEETDNIFDGLATGNYDVRVDDANGCSTGDSTVNVPVSIAGGIRSVFEFGEVLIYPNPTTGQLTVEIENRDQKDITLEIINLSGQLIWKKELQNNGQARFVEVIDMSQQAHGTYFMRVNGLPVNTKIILE